MSRIYIGRRLITLPWGICGSYEIVMLYNLTPLSPFHVCNCATMELAGSPFTDGVFFHGRVGSWVSQLKKEQFIYLPGVWISSLSIFSLEQLDSVLLASGEELNFYISFLTVFLKGYSSDVLSFETLFYAFIIYCIFLFCLNSKFTCKYFTFWKTYRRLKGKCLELRTSFCSWQSFISLNYYIIIGLIFT